MKNIKLILLLLLCSVLLVATKDDKRPVRIFMAGDSTMALKPLYKMVYDSISGDSLRELFPERGWGQLLPEYFDTNVIIEDYAQNGRSSRTFIEQGWWQKIIDNVQPGDYVVIQFGHNDSAKDRPDRYTPPADYVKNLSGFVDQVIAKKGKPIICTSVVRRRFDKNGNFMDSHGEYIKLALEVAHKKNITFIDMYHKSKILLMNLGPEKSIPLFLHVAVGESKIFPEGKTDNTHFRESGAETMAGLFVDGLKENNIEELTKYLK